MRLIFILSNHQFIQQTLSPTTNRTKQDRRRTSTGTIHFSEQVDDALKLIQKGTNSKVDGSPIQQLIYKEESSGGGGDDKGRKVRYHVGSLCTMSIDEYPSSLCHSSLLDVTEFGYQNLSPTYFIPTTKDDDNNDRKGGGDKGDDDNDSKGGGNKDSSSSNDRKGGPSSSSSSNDRKGGGSSSSSSSSGDARAIDDICKLGHNACDHDNENKGKKGTSDDSAAKIECDIACSTSLCSHDDRERMGCPPSSTAKFVQKGAEFKNAASPIQQLIYKDEEDGSDGSGDTKDGSDGSGDTKDDKDDEDRKGGGDNKDSSSSTDRKGGPSSSSSSNDRKGGPSSSSSSGDNGPSNDGHCDLDCGPETTGVTTRDFCDLHCSPESHCTDDEQVKMNCPGTSGDDERAWKKNLRRRNRKYD